VISPYYSEPELRGRAVIVSFSNYLPRQAMHFLQRSTHFLKTRCRPLITSKFLASELPFHGWKSPESGLYGGCSYGIPPIHFFKAEHRIQFRSRPMQFLDFSNQASSEARNFQVINSLQHVFEKGVERCKNSVACQGRYFERDRHRTYTKFRLGVIRSAHELCKQPCTHTRACARTHTQRQCCIYTRN
jgi:hypothetical protein